MSSTKILATKVVQLSASRVASYVGRDCRATMRASMLGVWKSHDPEGWRKAHLVHVDDAATAATTKTPVRRRRAKEEEGEVMEVMEHWWSPGMHPVVDRVLDASLNECPSDTEEVLHLRDVLIGEIRRAKGLSSLQKRKIQAAVQRNAFTSYGRRQQAPALAMASDMLCKRFVPHDGSILRKQLCEGVELVGKPDAVSEDGKTVLELKNRIHCLKDPLSPTDRYQLMAYMHLLDASEEGVLFQVLRLPKCVDVSIHRASRLSIAGEEEDRVWTDTRRRLAEFGAGVLRLSTDDNFASKFVSRL